MKRVLGFWYVLLGFIVLLSSCTDRKTANTLTIATSANMHFAMREIVSKFSKKTGIDCDLVISSSGKLTAQIKEGAPYDVLVSANLKYPNELYRSGLSRNPPRVYAYGKLVLWSMAEINDSLVRVLTKNSVEHIALANPKTAPYGTAAIEFLKHQGVYEQIKAKLVFGESISQVNQFISSQAAEVGFTAKAVVLSPEMTGQGNWVEVDTSTYAPIKQGIVVIEQDSKKTILALQFSEFIFSDEAKKILMKYGYSVDE